MISDVKDDMHRSGAWIARRASDIACCGSELAHEDIIPAAENPADESSSS